MEWKETLEPIVSFFYNNPVLAIILFWLLVGWLQWRSANDRFKENPEIKYDPFLRGLVYWCFLLLLIICYKLYFPF